MDRASRAWEILCADAVDVSRKKHRVGVVRRGAIRRLAQLEQRTTSGEEAPSISRRAHVSRQSSHPNHFLWLFVARRFKAIGIAVLTNLKRIPHAATHGDVHTGRPRLDRANGASDIEHGV